MFPKQPQVQEFLLHYIIYSLFFKRACHPNLQQFHMHTVPPLYRIQVQQVLIQIITHFISSKLTRHSTKENYVKISPTSETASVTVSSSAGINWRPHTFFVLQTNTAILKGNPVTPRLDVINSSRDSFKSSTYQLKYILISSLRTFVLITGDMVSKGSDSKTSRLTVQEIIDESSVIPLQPTDSTSPGIKH